MSEPARESAAATSFRTNLWVSTAYFAEGMPYALVRFLAGVYLTDIGIALPTLGRINFWLSLPWNLKFLWAPAVDIYATRRRWFLALQFGLVLSALALAAGVAFGPPLAPAGVAVAGLTQSPAVRAILALLVVMAALSATHDVAIDAFYMEAIPDPAVAAGLTGIRNVAYRLAVLFVKSGLVWLAGYAAWTWSFVGGALALLILWSLHLFLLPIPPERPVVASNMGAALSGFRQAFGTFVRQPQAALILLFLVTYKLGDEVMFSVNTPFLKRDLGVGNEDLSWIAGIVGTWASIGGSLLSAWAIRHWGWRKAVWPLTLGMNVNILAYVWLAWAHPDPHTASGLATIAVVHAYEQIAAGLGNAVLVVYIMRICDVRFKAAHYAIGSAIAPLGGTLFNYVSGDIVVKMGYANMYLLAFVCAIPAMICLRWLPMYEPEGAAR